MISLFFFHGFSCCSLFINCLLLYSYRTLTNLSSNSSSRKHSEFPVPEMHSLIFSIYTFCVCLFHNGNYSWARHLPYASSTRSTTHSPPSDFLPQNVDLYKLQETVIICAFWSFDQSEAMAGDQR